MDGKKAVFVYARAIIEARPPHDEPHIIISINCPGDEPARIRTNRATLGRLNLFVWDIDTIVPGVTFQYNGKSYLSDDVPPEHLFQPEHAKQIIDLVEAHPEAEDYVVHCTAGRSRSAAVAAALSKVLLGTDSSIFNNKRFNPNMRVYRMVLEEWYNRHPMETDNGELLDRKSTRLNSGDDAKLLVKEQLSAYANVAARRGL